MYEAAASYPIYVDARLVAPLSRWLWLVKWLLAIPHFVVLFFLWWAFVVMSVVAFFAHVTVSAACRRDCALGY